MAQSTTDRQVRIPAGRRSRVESVAEPRRQQRQVHRNDELVRTAARDHPRQRGSRQVQLAAQSQSEDVGVRISLIPWAG